MPFKSIRLPAATEGADMTPLIGLGAMIAKEAIPHLFARLGKSGTGAEKVAEAVAAVAMDVTGLGPAASPDEALTALRGDPEAYARVQEAATRLAIAELEHEAKMQEVAVQDRASAREMQIATGSRAPAVLAAVAGLFAFVGLGAAVWLNLQGQEPSTLVTTAITAALGFFASVIAFHFGSSAGSKAKTDVMSDEIRSGLPRPPR